MIHQYLDAVYGERQKTYLLNLFAFFIQHPNRRTNKIFIIKGEQGSGKTFLTSWSSS